MNVLTVYSNKEMLIIERKPPSVRADVRMKDKTNVGKKRCQNVEVDRLNATEKTAVL